MLLYRYHKNVIYVDNINLRRSPELETFLTFDQWKTFYTIDPANWENINCRYCSLTNNVWIPKYTPNGSNTPYFIKFKTARDYRKYKRFVKRIAHSHDDYKNTQEILELTKIFREVADKRAAEARAQTQAAYDNFQKQVEAIEKAASKYKVIRRGGEIDCFQVRTSDDRVIIIPRKENARE